jgi:hypothetical protein
LVQTTSGAQHLHIASLDRAPGFDALVADMARQFGAAEVTPQVLTMHDRNPDWDVIYPVSAVRALFTLVHDADDNKFIQFLSPRKIDLGVVASTEAVPSVSGDKIAISAMEDNVNFDKGTRSLSLRIDHPNVIWTGELYGVQHQ